MRVLVEGCPAGAPEPTEQGLSLPLLIKGEEGSAPEVVIVFTPEPIPGFDPNAIGRFRPMILDLAMRQSARGSWISWRFVRYTDDRPKAVSQ